jgi:hypothetical protein
MLSLKVGNPKKKYERADKTQIECNEIEPYHMEITHLTENIYFSKEITSSV